MFLSSLMKYSMFSLFFLFITLPFLVASEKCDVCVKRGADPTIFVDFLGAKVACASLYHWGEKPQRMTDSQCLEAKYLGMTECGCPEVSARDICYLCEDKSRAKKNDTEIFTGLTCTAVEQLYLREGDHCGAIQQTAGVYCGCESNKKSASCRICPDDSLLYDPTRIVASDGTTVPGGRTLTCAQVEYTANLPGYDCPLLQALFSSQCCVSQTVDSSSTIAVTLVPTSSTMIPLTEKASELLTTASPSSLQQQKAQNVDVIAESSVQLTSSSAKLWIHGMLLLVPAVVLIV